MSAFGARSVVGHGRSSLEIAEEKKKIFVFLFSLQGFFFKLKIKSHGFFQLCEKDLLVRGTSSSYCASLRCD